MNEMTTMNGSTALSTGGGFDPFAAYGQEAANGGNFIKFNRGEWLIGQDGKEVELGHRYVANMNELSIGWLRWADGKVAERRMGLLVSGFRPEPRDQLGHTDQELWETDDDGKPKDPWTLTNDLPLADAETGEQVTFAASSKGGIGCIGNLCKAFAKERHAKADLVPVLALGRDSYMHPVYKKTYVPVLAIVDWIANDGVPQPNPENDDEPAEPAPAAKASAGGKTRF